MNIYTALTLLFMWVHISSNLDVKILNASFSYHVYEVKIWCCRVQLLIVFVLSQAHQMGFLIAVICDTHFIVYDISAQKHRDAECQVLKGILESHCERNQLYSRLEKQPYSLAIDCGLCFIPIEVKALTLCFCVIRPTWFYVLETSPFCYLYLLMFIREEAERG